jgi:hypothetical protein
MENIFLHGKIKFPGEKLIFLGENNLSLRDNIYPQRKKYFPEELDFDPVSKKKSEKVPLTGFALA